MRDHLTLVRCLFSRFGRFFSGHIWARCVRGVCANAKIRLPADAFAFWSLFLNAAKVEFKITAQRHFAHGNIETRFPRKRDLESVIRCCHSIFKKRFVERIPCSGSVISLAKFKNYFYVLCKEIYFRAIIDGKPKWQTFWGRNAKCSASADLTSLAIFMPYAHVNSEMLR